jgi:hypothetical protein|tara:strand:- start:63 stop:467 length:405 start_codon:yes stop_codon:yes gene_type:complete
MVKKAPSQQNGLMLLVLAVLIFIVGFVAWMILDMNKSDESAVLPPPNGPIQVRGEILCLPHKDTGGVQTQECAYGLQDDEGRYYALGGDSPTGSGISDFPFNERAVVTGTFERGDSPIYPITGTIEVTNIAPPK